MEPLEINDFGGGIVDATIGAAVGRMAEMINVELYPSDDGMKVRQRPALQAFTDRLATGDQTIGGIFNRSGTTFAQSSSKLYNATTGAEVTNPAGGNAFLIVSTTTAAATSYSSDPYHIFVNTKTYNAYSAMYCMHYTSTGQVILPLGLRNPSIDSYTHSGVAKNYLYKVYYKYVYSAYSPETGEPATQTFYGPVSSAFSAAFSSNTLTIYNDASYFYYSSPTDEKGRLFIVLCRTTDSGSVYYEVSSTAVTSAGSTQTITDSATDATIVTGNLAYFEEEMTNTYMGDTFGPSSVTSSYIKSHRNYNGRLYVLYLNDQLYHSKANRPREFGDTAFTYIPELTYGLGATPNGIVVFGYSGVFRIDGVFDDTGDGAMVPSRLGTVTPPISHDCVVDTDVGCFWLAYDGVWFTDGFNIKRVSIKSQNYIMNVVQRISSTSKHFIHGSYSPFLGKVFWSISKNGLSSGSSSILVYDARYSDDNREIFYTWRGPEGVDTCVCAGSTFDAAAIFANTHGYLYNLMTSPLSTVVYDSSYVAGSSSSAWPVAAIQYQVQTAEYDFGNKKARKYVPTLSAAFDIGIGSSGAISTYGASDDYGLCTALSFANDGKGVNTALKPALLPYSAGIKTIKRHFTARKLRCYTRSILLSNAYVALYNTNDYGVVDINSTTKTATFSNTVAYDWPTEVVGYYISFETDGYVRDYLITVRSADTLTFSDAGNYSVTGTGKGFTIRGYPKGQVFNLLSLAMNYETNGNSLDPYNTVDSKEL